MTTETKLPNPWINYPELKLFDDPIIALADLPAADRALIVFDIYSGSWAMLFVRDGDRFRVFDDIDAAHGRSKEGCEHCTELFPQEVIREASVNRDVDSMIQGLNEGYYNGFTFGKMVEREHGTFVDSYINIHPRDEEAVRRREALQKLFSTHLGVDFDDLVATGGEWNWDAEQLENTGLISALPLRPLTPIAFSSPLRFLSWGD